MTGSESTSDEETEKIQLAVTRRTHGADKVKEIALLVTTRPKECYVMSLEDREREDAINLP